MDDAMGNQAARVVSRSWARLSRQFRDDGFCRVPGQLDVARLDRLRVAADALGERWSAKVGDELLRAQGSMVDVAHMRDAVFGELIADPRMLDTLARLGLGAATFTDGYVISKPGHSPRLFWHFDWYGWQHPSAQGIAPPQVFVMYYLTDTTPANGCLRVIPGSHRRRHQLHDVMTDGHTELRSARELDRPEFADYPEEISVPVHAGDVLVGDARILHAAHANSTNERRSLITLWYQPHFERLPGPVQATLVAKQHALPSTWPAATTAAVAALHPRYRGGDAPLARNLDGPGTSAT